MAGVGKQNHADLMVGFWVYSKMTVPFSSVKVDQICSDSHR